MNKLKLMLITTAFSGLVLSGHSSATEKSVAPNSAKADYGFVRLDICSLPVPETKATYQFNQDGQHCENNKSSQFTLENVPSATLIQFYTSDTCTDFHASGEGYVKLKTTKQPTTWKDPLSFNDFKSTTPGYLVPGKNLRVEEMWDGLPGHGWNERISCVYIERSQPVN